jgi:hypothetical protein
VKSGTQRGGASHLHGPFLVDWGYLSWFTFNFKPLFSGIADLVDEDGAKKIRALP